MKQTVIQNSSYSFRRNGTYHYYRRAPTDLCERFNRDRAINTSQTRSRSKVPRSASNLSDRLERHSEILMLELFHSRELGLSLIYPSQAKQVDAPLSLNDAVVFRDQLIERGMSSASVKHVFASVDYVTKRATIQHERNYTNVFAGAFILADAPTAKRLTIPEGVTKSIQEECRTINDENRWLLSLMSDTVMRLLEAAGLRLNDFQLDEDISYLN